MTAFSVVTIIYIFFCQNSNFAGRKLKNASFSIIFLCTFYLECLPIDSVGSLVFALQFNQFQVASSGEVARYLH